MHMLGMAGFQIKSVKMEKYIINLIFFVEESIYCVVINQNNKHQKLQRFQLFVL